MSSYVSVNKKNIFKPMITKLVSDVVTCSLSATLIFIVSCSSDQLFAFATYCLVAVMYASGVNKPPNQIRSPLITHNMNKTGTLSLR